MGNGKKEITVGINLKARVEDAAKGIEKLQKSLEGFDLSKGLSADISKEFRKIENELKEIEKRTSSGEISIIDAKSVEKSLDKIEKDWNYLISKLNSHGLFEKGLKEDATVLKFLESLQTEYTRGMKEAEAQQQKLTKQLEKAKQHETELLETQKKQQVVSESQLKDQKTKASIAEQQAKEALKVQKEAEKALREKIANSGGKYSTEDITKKGSDLRKTEAYRKFAAAQNNYEAAQKTAKSEKTKTESMVTKEMQVESAQKAKEAIEEATKALEQYQRTTLEIAKTEAFEKAKKALQEMAEFKDIDWSAFNIDLKEIKSVDDLKSAIARLRVEAGDKAQGAIKKLEETIDSTGGQFSQMGKEAEGAKDSLEQLNEEASQTAAFEAKIKSFLGLAGATEVLRRAVRDAMATIKELDATMTQMAVVTDLTVGDYWDQLPEYSMRATELGVSINSAYEAATLYYQQGLKTNEVNAISAETLKMAKIAGMDAAEATNKMTAALRGFNMELNEASAQKVADVYSQLAAITAADTNEIASAMTKTASIASSAGMEFETTAAFLSQIIETTRESAETAGTAMKTVIARFQELKKDPSEIGEVEGEIVDANKIETALRSVGVALRDTKGQFRDLDDVFIELSGKWDSLDTNTQRYIATIAAGSRQQSRFIAMMSNYSRTQELVTAANTSAGASNKQFEKTMDSLEAKIAKLENAWHEFTMGIMNSDLVKAGVDILTKLLEVINKATSGFKGMAGSITKILGIMTVFKLGKTIFDKLREPMVKFFADIVKEAGVTGEKAGKAAREGLARSKQSTSNQGETTLPDGYKYDKNGKVHRKDGSFASKEEVAQITQQNIPTLGQKIVSYAGEKTGASKIIDGGKQLGAANKQRREIKKDIAKTQTGIENLKLSKGLETTAEGAKAAEDEIFELEKHLKNLKKQDAELLDQGKKGWGDMVEGIGQAGAAITGFGVGVSMLGGLFSSLGLEEVGEGFATAGNLIMMFGGALTAVVPAIKFLGTTFQIEGGKIAIAGTTAQLAWWWVLLIVAAVAALIAITAIAINNMKKASPEGKLKSAQEAADAAGEAADRAAEAYDNLRNSLEDLESGYEALDNLRKGTEEWQQAVNELNSSVLDLITQYPELAALVKQEGGVLKLDVDSKEVQAVLKDYQIEKSVAAGAALATKAKVVEAQRRMDYASLDAVEAVGSYRGSRNSVANDATVQKAVEGLANEVLAKGPMYRGEMQSYLQRKGVSETEASILATEFAKDKEALNKFAASLTETTAQQKAYYTSVAAQAQTMLDLSRYTEEEAAQMSSVVGAEAVERYIQVLDDKYADDDSETTEKALKNYFKEQGLGEVKNIRDNKIVYFDKEGQRQVVDKKTYIEQMKAAEATQMAADAMEKVPAAINKAAEAFGKNASAFEKAFAGREGENLNLRDVDKLKDIQTDEEGKYAEEGEIAAAWKKLSQEEREVWGDDFQKFAKDYDRRIDLAREAFAEAVENMHYLGFEGEGSQIFVDLSAENAKAMSEDLLTLSAGGGDVAGYKTQLDAILDGLSEEQANAVMSQINAMDMTDIDAWTDLKYVFDEMNIPVATEELQNFVDKGIEVAGAIKKIDFDNFNKELHDTYELIQKIKGNNGRTFTEEEYKELVGSNKALGDQFKQIGKDYVYVGSSMDTLVKALEENTISNIEEANRQLDSKTAFSQIAARMDSKDINNMDENELRDYLIDAMGKVAAQGLDIADLGESGLTNKTDLYAQGVDKDQLLEWAKAFAATGGLGTYYQELKAENMRDAEILKYVYGNSATRNAELASTDTKYAEALMIQAIQSGGVSEALLEKYRKAIESGDINSDEFKALSKTIANSTEAIVKAAEGRSTVVEIVDRIVDALYQEGQKQIDKLSEIQDATETANSNLISKIQEQINEQRQARQNEETEKNISDMRSRMAFLGMDSGNNALALKELEEQIKDAEQTYQDSLVDQAIQDLQNANEKAAEQRERQISLAQQQLDWQKDHGVLTTQAEKIAEESANAIKAGVAPLQTTMGQLLWGAEGGNLSKFATEEWVKDLQLASTALVDYFNQQTPTPTPTPTPTGGNVSNLASRGGTTLRASLEGPKQGNLLAPESAEGASSNEKREESIRSATRVAIKNKAFTEASLESLTTSDAGMAAWLDYYRRAGGKQEDFYSNVLNAAQDSDEYKNWFGQIGSVYKGIDQGGKTGKRLYKNHKENAKMVKGLIRNTENYAEYNVRLDDAGTDDGAGIGTAIFKPDATDYIRNVYEGEKAMNQARWDGIMANHAGKPVDFELGYYDGNYYIYRKATQAWHLVIPDMADGEEAYRVLNEARLNGTFKTGGLADFTGPAWLDGTKSKPEIVLNQQDSANFIQLRDILAEVLDSSRTGDNISNSSTNGDNYFTIDINVESIENDYDVEKLATKIRSMLYEDASYRNVRAIGGFR